MSDWTDKLSSRALGEEDGFHGHDESLENIAEAEKPVIVAVAEPAPQPQPIAPEPAPAPEAQPIMAEPAPAPEAQPTE